VRAALRTRRLRKRFAPTAALSRASSQGSSPAGERLAAVGAGQEVDVLAAGVKRVLDRVAAEQCFLLAGADPQSVVTGDPIGPTGIMR
jgi:hypothetical protein